MNLTSDGYIWKPHEDYELRSNWYDEMCREAGRRRDTRKKLNALKEAMRRSKIRSVYFRIFGNEVIKLQRLPKLQFNNFRKMMWDYKEQFAVYEVWHIIIKGIPDYIPQD